MCCTVLLGMVVAILLEVSGKWLESEFLAKMHENNDEICYLLHLNQVQA